MKIWDCGMIPEFEINVDDFIISSLSFGLFAVDQDLICEMHNSRLDVMAGCLFQSL